MTNTELQYGTEVIVEVKIQNNLLPNVFPNAPTVEVYRGTLQKRAAYDNKDAIRLVCKGQFKLRVIEMKDIVSFNGQPFVYTPTKKLAMPESAPRTVNVVGSNNKTYILTIHQTGRIYCSCPGFGFRGKCRHVDDYLKENGK